MDNDPQIGPILVAHRGYALRYPENTLIAIEAAVEAGAACVEFDVQMSGDGVPVLLHDADLRRTGGVDGRVTEMPLEAIRRVDVSERARLDATFENARIPTLAETVARLAQWPDVLAFVEIKRASLRKFGPPVVDRVIEELRTNLDRCVVISYDRDAVLQARGLGAPAIGWVLEEWSDATRHRAEQAAPDYLVCEYGLLPAEPAALWSGPWQWVLYDADTPELALQLAARGARYVETMAIGEMLSDPRLAQGGRARA
ncbi:MAG: glycerophosphodiester phosphodiesterase family protein [Planctomycetota bacterium]